MEANNNYNFSLFKPVSEYSRRVRNIIFSTLIIWVVAVFGFQILLRVIEKPTPEKAYITFESVWDKVKAGNATGAEKTDFANSLAAVLGKSAVKKENKEILAAVLSWSTFAGLDNSRKEALMKSLGELKANREVIAGAKDDISYLAAKEAIANTKSELVTHVSEVYGFAPAGLQANIIAFNLNDTDIQQLSENDINALPGIMKLYLIHNQSFLTDTKFLGFPFHYFYTGEFLLILFVLLCLVYSKRIDRLQKKYSIIE